MPQGAVAYWRVGTPGRRAPLVCLHGGPGLPHDYLAPLAGLSGEREVIFYDQAGCGRSDRAEPERSWTISYFLDELAAVLAALDVQEFHLFGNSWGGWLALEYVLGRPRVLPASLIVSSSPPSIERWIADVTALRAGLPADVTQVLDDHERAGTTASRDYRRALAEFNRRHMCRVQPWPQELRAATGGFGDEVYAALWGASEFGPVTGALRDWDCSARLAGISTPTLVTGGRFDEAAPDSMAELAAGIPDARLQIFENSSHTAFLEEPELYLAEVSRFLAAVEAGTAVDARERRSSSGRV